MRGASAGTDPELRVSWDSVLNAERTGRWWIVGSAWSGAPMVDGGLQKAPQKPLAGTVRGGPSPRAGTARGGPSPRAGMARGGPSPRAAVPGVVDDITEAAVVL